MGLGEERLIGNKELLPEERAKELKSIKEQQAELSARQSEFEKSKKEGDEQIQAEEAIKHAVAMKKLAQGKSLLEKNRKELRSKSLPQGEKSRRIKTFDEEEEKLQGREEELKQHKLPQELIFGEKLEQKESWCVAYKGKWGGKSVIIKQIDSVSNARRFRREAELLRRLQGPAFIPRLIGVDVEEKDHQAYLMIESVELPSLLDYLKKIETPLSEVACVKLALQIAEAVYYLHRNGVVHADLNSGNILLKETAEGESILAVITGFDRSKIISQSRSSVTTASPIGEAVAYYAPEVLSGGKATFESDAYSLGVLFWECCAGKPPFDGMDKEEIRDMRLDCIEEGADKTESEDKLSQPFFRELIKECWNVKPSLRPSLQAIIERLQVVYQKKPAEMLLPSASDLPDSAEDLESKRAEEPSLAPSSPVESVRQTPIHLSSLVGDTSLPTLVTIADSVSAESLRPREAEYQQVSGQTEGIHQGPKIKPLSKNSR